MGVERETHPNTVSTVHRCISFYSYTTIICIINFIIIRCRNKRYFTEWRIKYCYNK
jgi:hypothetical protein